MLVSRRQMKIVLMALIMVLSLSDAHALAPVFNKEDLTDY
jgi:hypothetical protein